MCPTSNRRAGGQVGHSGRPRHRRGLCDGRRAAASGAEPDQRPADLRARRTTRHSSRPPNWTSTRRAPSSASSAPQRRCRSAPAWIRSGRCATPLPTATATASAGQAPVVTAIAGPLTVGSARRRCGCPTRSWPATTTRPSWSGTGTAPISTWPTSPVALALGVDSTRPATDSDVQRAVMTRYPATDPLVTPAIPQRRPARHRGTSAGRRGDRLGALGA